jgi:mannose-6-phosphate isomerase-like protein (cupin superfamily)
MTLSTTQPSTAPFVGDIVALAKRNPYFREVVSTGPHAQVVVMTIPPGGEIGEEVHGDVDQVLVVVEGDGIAVLAATGASRGPTTSCTSPPARATTSSTRVRST